jgi:nucleoside 2-deoxyribosyltransferase
VIEVKAPARFDHSYSYRIFLAGSIEMGTAEKWQNRLAKDLAEQEVVLLNPRRDDWDSSWVQEASNPQFAEQVNWEQDEMVNADTVIFYFDPTTKSPITLMELGLMLGLAPRKVIVCCPDGFWRKGNVEIMCYRHRVPMVSSYQELINKLLSKLNNADFSSN